MSAREHGHLDVLTGRDVVGDVLLDGGLGDIAQGRELVEVLLQIAVGPDRVVDDLFQERAVVDEPVRLLDLGVGTVELAVGRTVGGQVGELGDDKVTD